MDKPVGQWLTNLRRPGGLGKDPERAARRAEHLVAIDPDWNPGALGWTVDWQRHHTGLGALLKAGGTLEEIVPGVTYRGDDIGRWLARQVRDWARLNEEQQRRLGVLGVKPAERPHKASARTSAKAGAARGSEAFTRGVAALQQYIAREARTVVPRGHTEVLEGCGTPVRLGVWLSNQRNRRDRLSEQQLAALAELGLDWA
ncbi:helicase associated domain-containing protein [Streptomyces sp. ISL-96]|uniref:helicase associated domain-containing protein n=1 Tax=Streptomyces sp. ISL-96 TaxID=2819191 RepID=UPI001BEAD0CC|nr:helicase associated domain-containing protein [Streptomyces sp. ISL-96]MBT2493907.1 helicase associated domain-containing protein [Streptomyces sp. ISL-96]